MPSAILGMLIVGLIAGALARLLVPGRQRLGCLGTILLGVAGSFVGGTLGNLIFHGELDIRPSGVLGSVIGAALLLIIATRMRRG